MQRPRRWQWAGLAAGTAAFLVVTLDVLTGGPISGMDRAIYDRVTAWHEAGWAVHWWGEAIAKPVAPPYASALTVAVVVWWWATGPRRYAGWAAGASLAVAILITVLKQSFRRELPPLAAGAWYGYSFPSGHTIGAVANLGLLVLLAAQRRIDRRGLRGPEAQRTWAIAVAAWVVLGLAQGIARILSQRHWASDVFASWGIGVALVCATLLLAGVPSAPARTPGATSAGPHFMERAT